jgi:hypothetical protein
MSQTTSALPSAEEIGKLVPIGRIAKDTPYSADFMRQLARSGKLRAYKLHRDWLTTPEAVHTYLKSQTKRHEKALSLLQAAEKAFLALALVVIVFSATPKARAQGLSNPPPRQESTMSAILHSVKGAVAAIGRSFFGSPSESGTIITYSKSHLISATQQALAQNPSIPPPPKITFANNNGDPHSEPPQAGPKFSISATLHDLTVSWHNFGSFYGQQLSTVFRINKSALVEQGSQIHTALLWQSDQVERALLSLGQALLGKTTEEYLADEPVPTLAMTKRVSRHGDLPLPTAMSAVSYQPEVLGLSTSLIPQNNNPATSGVTQGQIQTLIDQTLSRSLASGQFKGQQGAPGPQGPPGASSSGIVQNGNGQTTAVIGGNPIVTYVPAVTANNFSGTSLAGFGSLSAGTFTSGNTTISGNLSVSGPASVGSITSSGAATIGGVFSAGTSTLSSLTVSGPATFSGSTTIAGLTVTGLNPGLTLGSVAFQGASALAQDNANFFYDSTSHRLGLGTTTPAQLLSVAGNMRLTGALFDSNNASGTLGMLLETTGTGTQWVATSTLGISAGASASGTPGNIQFVGAGNTLNATSLFTWDNSLNRLAIGTSSLTSTFTLQGASGSAPLLTIASSTGASLFTVLANGNVGIGTTSPTQLLEVNGGVKFDSTVQLSSFSAGTAPYINSNSQVGQYVLDRNGRPYLRNWQGTLGNIGQGTANTVATIIFGPGDSWMSNHFWTDAVQNWLYSQWGRSGLGYVGISSSYGNFNQTPPSGITLSESGTWTNTVPGTSSPNYCPDLADAVSNDLTGNSTTTLTFSGGITKVVVYYIKQPNGASFNWNMDSGAQSGTINTANASVAAATLTISGLSGTASHTLTFTPTGSGSSGVDVCGADAQNPSQNGIHVVNLSYQGTQASTWNAANQTVWQAEIASLNPTLDVVEFGGNEMSANVTPSTFNTNLQTVAANIKAAAPNADCLMQSQVDVSIPGATYNMGQYANAMQDAAVSSGCAFINTYDNFPSYTVGNAEGLYSSPTHLDYAGGEDMARLTRAVLSDGIVYPLISQGSIGGNNLFIGPNVGSVAHTGVGTGNVSLSGFGNVIIGSNSMQNATGVAVQNNTALGASALTAFTSGNSNVAIGQGALAALVSANANTTVGQLSLANNTGAFNTALGYNAGNGNTSGTLNTYLGFQSGKTGTNNLTYATCLGADCVPSGSHTVTLGRYLENTVIPGNASIGTTTISSALTLQGTTSTVSLLNIASSSGLSVLYVANNGNVGIGTSTPTLGPLTMASGAYVSAGGTWTNASDRNLKENFATLTPADILQKIDDLPVTEWDYKTEGPSIKHIGPVAQDFYAIFQVGNSPTSISTIDPGGIAFLGIQALDQKITALQGSLTGNATATDLTVYVPGNFSGDSVGEAEILGGQSSVRVTFTEPYQYQPIITLTPEDQTASGEFVTDRNSTGFTIRTPLPVTSDTTFAWHSFASPAEQLTVSDGTTQPIQLTVVQPSADSQPANALPVVSSPTIDAVAAADVSASSTPDSTASTTAASLSASSTPQVLDASTTIPASSTSSSISTGPQPDTTPTPVPPPTPTPMPLQAAALAPTPTSPSPSETTSSTTAADAAAP